MIGEAFSSVEWGSDPAAGRALKRRAAKLREAGYATYQDRKKVGLVGNTMRYLFAFQSQEDHDMVVPRNRDSTDRTLNIRTAHIGLRVEIPTYATLDPPAYAGMTGTIKALELTKEGKAWVGVAMHAWPGSPLILFQPHELIQEGSKS
jgi:hypothetical protein